MVKATILFGKTQIFCDALSLDDDEVRLTRPSGASFLVGEPFQVFGAQPLGFRTAWVVGVEETSLLCSFTPPATASA